MRNPSCAKRLFCPYLCDVRVSCGSPFAERTEVAYEEDVDVESTMVLFSRTLLVLVSVTPQTETQGFCPHLRDLVVVR